MQYVRVSLRECRKEARQRTDRAFRRSFSAGCFLYFFAFSGISAAAYAVTRAVSRFLPEYLPVYAALFFAFSTVGAVLLLAPLHEGLKRYAQARAEDEAEADSALTAFYRQVSLHRYAWRRGAGRMATWVLFCGAVVGIGQLGVHVGNRLLSGGDPVRAALILGLSLLFMLAVAVFAYEKALSRYLCYLSAARFSDGKYREHKACSAVWMKSFRGKILRMRLSFFPLFLLCFLTCGVMLPWVMPYYALSEAVLIRKLTIG